MKISKNQLRKIIQKEIYNSVNKSFSIDKEVTTDSVLLVTENFNDSFELVIDQNLINETENNIKELKTINEELKRMKQLVDFRSPLMMK